MAEGDHWHLPQGPTFDYEHALIFLSGLQHTHTHTHTTHTDTHSERERERKRETERGEREKKHTHMHKPLTGHAALMTNTYIRTYNLRRVRVEQAISAPIPIC